MISWLLNKHHKGFQSHKPGGTNNHNVSTISPSAKIQKECLSTLLLSTPSCSYFYPYREGDRPLYSPCAGYKPVSSYLLTNESRAERKPRLLLEFVRVLLRFRQNTPALEVLFQLPPRFGKRMVYHPKLLSSVTFYPLAKHSSYLIKLFGPILVLFQR